MTFLSKNRVRVATGLRVISAVLAFSILSTVAADGRLHLIGYAHLDSQWLWTYEKTIDPYLKKTLEKNFALFEKYPEYQFNFTGAFRYELMREYYPEHYERLKGYVKAGRWHVSGSSWEENDTLVVNPESILRQILYGNRFFAHEFGVTSNDYMLPDCFGFPAALPSLLSHAGIEGFSSQKLSWGAQKGIPFNLGVWRGPDGSQVFAALNPGPYGGHLREPPHTNAKFLARLEENRQLTGLALDYRYYGVGDRGGAPREADVENLITSLRTKNKSFDVVSGKSGAIFSELKQSDTTKLPIIEGDQLLVEHSAGSLNSRGKTKQRNRSTEILALQAEKAAVVSEWATGLPYPQEKLERSWQRLLATQMHDILPGTSIPKAYLYSDNDQRLAANGFAEVFQTSMASIANAMDTSAPGVPLVVFNPLSVARDDLVTVRIPVTAIEPGEPQIFDSNNQPLLTQQTAKTAEFVELIFPARLDSMEIAVFSLRWLANKPIKNTLVVTETALESELLRVSLDAHGDLEQIFNKKLRRNTLSAPMRYQLLNEYPRRWPAWNMTWNDRRLPAREILTGPADVDVVEQGPLRATLRIVRTQAGSRFTQFVRVSANSPVVEVAQTINWHTPNSSLKLAFPLAVKNELASYDMGLNVAERPTNFERQFEVPVHNWMDLSDARFGVSVFNDGKYGADKPNQFTLRQTLLYSPNAPKGEYEFGANQDFGDHAFRIGVYSHDGTWKSADTRGLAERFNAPLVAFSPVEKRVGPLGRRFQFIRVNCPEQIALRVAKKVESGPQILIRMHELKGGAVENCSVQFAAPVRVATRVNGQEQPLSQANVRDGELTVSLPPFGLASFALELEKPKRVIQKQMEQVVALPMNEKIFRTVQSDTPTPLDDKAFPADRFPATLTDGGVTFHLNSETENPDAMFPAGQTVALPSGAYRTLHLLAAAKQEGVGSLLLGNNRSKIELHSWQGTVKGGTVAAYASHTLMGHRRLPYQFSYLYHYKIPLLGARQVTFPHDSNLFVVAATVADDVPATLLSPLFPELPSGRNEARRDE